MMTSLIPQWNPRRLSAVRAEPMCKKPVGEGAKRTRGAVELPLEVGVMLLEMLATKAEPASVAEAQRLHQLRLAVALAFAFSSPQYLLRQWYCRTLARQKSRGL